nr:hypothetical protein [uncultured bacterium]
MTAYCEAPAPATAEQSSDSKLRVPDLPSADMRLSWSDFRSLIELLQEQPKADKPAEDKPPVPWSLQSATYTAQELENGAIRVDADIALQVWDTGWAQIPILGDAAALESAELDGEASNLLRKDAWFNVLIHGAGAHGLKLHFYAMREEKEGVVTASFPAAAAPISTMHLTLSETDVEISSPTAANIAVTKEEGKTKADIVFTSSDRIEATWRLPAPALPVQPKEPPQLTAELWSLVTVNETHLACDTTVHLSILKGELNAFDIDLPARAQLQHIEGTGAETDTSVEGDLQHLHVRINHAVTDHYPLHLRYEVPLPEGPGTIEIPRLGVGGATRQTGFIGVATRGNVEAVLANDFKEARRVDTRDLPRDIELRSAQPVLDAVQLSSKEYSVTLDVRRLEDVPVRVAGIDSARIETIFTPEGLNVTRVSYLVRNNLKKFLSVDVGEGADIWSASVNGEPVRPARDASNTAVMVPLLRSDQPGSAGTFPVELIYMRRAMPQTGLRSNLTLEAPRPDILTNSVEWEIRLPDSRIVYRSTGDLQVSSHAFAPLRIAGTSLLERIGKPGEPPATIYRLREGIERFYITDINNPAASAAAQSARFNGAQSSAPPAPAAAIAPIDATVSGVLPIHVDLPLVGAPHYFTRDIVPQGTPLRVTLDTYDARINLLPNFLLYVAAFTVGAWLVFQWRRISRRGAHLVRTAIVSAFPVGVLVYLAVATEHLVAPLLIAAAAGAALAWVLTDRTVATEAMVQGPGHD